MHRLILFVFTALLAVVLAEGQYYVPRAYYTIDTEGHASAPVPLRRLRRSLNPYPYPYPYNSGATANANANAEANTDGWGGNANANANANARASSGGWDLPGGGYGASNPNVLSAGQSRRLAGSIAGGRSISASSSVGLDSTGKGHYDTSASVSR